MKSQNPTPGPSALPILPHKAQPALLPFISHAQPQKMRSLLHPLASLRTVLWWSAGHSPTSL